MVHTNLVWNIFFLFQHYCSILGFFGSCRSLGTSTSLSKHTNPPLFFWFLCLTKGCCLLLSLIRPPIKSIKIAKAIFMLKKTWVLFRYMAELFLSIDQNPGDLLYIGDYPTHSYRDYNNFKRISRKKNQYFECQCQGFWSCRRWGNLRNPPPVLGCTEASTHQSLASMDGSPGKVGGKVVVKVVKMSNILGIGAWNHNGGPWNSDELECSFSNPQQFKEYDWRCLHSKNDSCLIGTYRNRKTPLGICFGFYFWHAEWRDDPQNPTDAHPAMVTHQFPPDDEGQVFFHEGKRRKSVKSWLEDSKIALDEHLFTMSCFPRLIALRKLCPNSSHKDLFVKKLSI